MALIAAIAVLMVGLLLILAGKSTRQRHGLADAPTLALDNRTLYSARYRLAGRPDRILGGLIPEEWKSGTRVYDSHRVQLGCYLVLIEEETGVRPTHGFISLASGQVRIENTPELRAWVLGVAEEVREMRRHPDRPIPVNQPPAKCRNCGMREHCEQRSG